VLQLIIITPPFEVVQ